VCVCMCVCAWSVFVPGVCVCSVCVQCMCVCALYVYVCVHAVCVVCRSLHSLVYTYSGNSYTINLLVYNVQYLQHP